MHRFMSRRMVFRARRLVAFSLTTAALHAGVLQNADAAERPGIQTVAISGTAAPGNNPGTTITGVNYSGPSISPNGTLVFPGNLSNESTGIFAGTSPANLQLVAQQSQYAPGTAGQFLTGNTSPPINATNEIAAGAFLWPGVGGVGSNNDEGVWIGFPSAATLVAREGSPAPYPPGDKFGSFSGTFSTQAPVLNDQGLVAFQSGLQNSAGTPISGAVDWILYGGTLQPVIATGAPVTGQAPGTSFTSIGSPGLTATQQVLYSGAYSVPGGATGSGIWLATPGFTIPVAATGQSAPGTLGDTFASVSYRSTSDGTNVHANQVGGTIYFASIAGPGVTPGTNDQGVWIGGIGPSASVARQGDAAPGLPGDSFSSFSDTGISNVSIYGIMATVAGPGITSSNSTGIWTGQPGNLHLVIRNGDTIADGASAPLNVTGLDHFTMNDFGQILTQLADGSLVGTNHAGQLTIVARPGDQLEVAPGDFRTISLITPLAGGETVGGATALNDAGIVAFAATFTDGTSGAFTSAALTVPEPASCALAVTGLLGLVLLRRKFLRGANPSPA